MDDWAAVVHGGEQVAALARLDNPEEERFRPAWLVWGYLQWHTFDAPGGLVGPNAWNLLRLAILVAGLALLVALALPPPRTRLEALLQGPLAALPPFLVLTVPKLARDLARFGPQEPLLVGGMALGGSLLVLAAREALRPAPVRRSRALLLAGAGGVLWLAGVYQKETALAALPLLAAVLLAGRRALRRWHGLSAARRRALAALGAVLLLPLAHVAAASALLALRGDLVYGAEAGRGIGDGLRLLYEWSSEVFSPDQRRLVLVSVGLTGLVALARRSPDWVALGALAAGGLSLLLAAQSGVVTSRYYLPAFALAGVALALALGRLPPLVQAGAVGLLALAFLPAGEARREVAGWTAEEQAGSALVDLIARLEARGCPVAMAGIDEETQNALQVLVARELGERTARSSCSRDSVYLVLRPWGEGAALASACAPGALARVREPFLLEGGAVEAYRCSRLRRDPVRDPLLGVLEARELVAARRFRPRLPG
ncbi:MAG TPA: hypothetical protein VNJ46_06615 [Gaiellaceae bacterium]|nr:hypothetical protein [Gaiellaceae bacterium]